MNPERVAQVLAVGTNHAQVETACELDNTMATLVPDPVYEFFPVGLRMRGTDAVRRYYENLMKNFLPNVESAEVIDEWCNENSLNQEYDVRVRVDGKLERHRVLGILVVEGDLLSGERIYGSERALRLMLGDVYDELEPI
ncbi:MAG: hypothetical protein JRH16_21850 [Deltaproteobacteria bacterium]|nr:hypothetical protein [Deltaproteobacteria bacterium]